MIALIDEQSIFSYVSPSHLHVLGYQTEDLIGKNATSFIHRQDQQNFAKLIESILENPQTHGTPGNSASGTWTASGAIWKVSSRF